MDELIKTYQDLMQNAFGAEEAAEIAADCGSKNARQLRRAASIADAAFVEFDEAHPEIKAEIDSRRRAAASAALETNPVWLGID